MYKLLIVDDEPLVQVGIKSMLNWEELNISLCGIAMNGQAALDIIQEEHPDIVITDIKMPIMSGLELIRICREQFGNEQPAFIILTSYEDFQMAKEALRYQVTDYLIKLELTAETLRTGIERVLNKLSKNQIQEESAATNMQILCDKFFIRLLNNLFDSREQFLLQSKDLNLSFDYAGYVCCYLELCRHTPNEIPLEKQAALFHSTLQMLREIINKYASCYVVSLDLKHCAVIFCCGEAGKLPDNSSKLQAILATVSDTLRKYYNVSLRGGIGTLAVQPLEIADSYQFARQASSYTTPRQPLLPIESCSDSTTPRSLFNISIFKDTLRKSFEEYDSDSLHKTLTQIIDLFLAHPDHYVQALDGACNILYLSISLMNDGEEQLSRIFAGYPDNYRSIYKQATVEQIAEWLQFFRDRMCTLFQETKKEHRNHIVTHVKKYIAENIRERLTLNEVASYFNISANYLSQLFKKYNDMGFNEYVTYLKIEEAKQLLHSSSYKVYEVADMLGFESAFYFSKVFKKVVGIAPTEYQNQAIL